MPSQDDPSKPALSTSARLMLLTSLSDSFSNMTAAQYTALAAQLPAAATAVASRLDGSSKKGKKAGPTGAAPRPPARKNSPQARRPRPTPSAADGKANNPPKPVSLPPKPSAAGSPPRVGNQTRIKAAKQPPTNMPDNKMQPHPYGMQPYPGMMAPYPTNVPPLPPGNFSQGKSYPPPWMAADPNATFSNSYPPSKSMAPQGNMPPPAPTAAFPPIPPTTSLGSPPIAPHPLQYMFAPSPPPAAGTSMNGSQGYRSSPPPKQHHLPPLGAEPAQVSTTLREYVGPVTSHSH